jgi:hypothetical protein
MYEVTCSYETNATSDAPVRPIEPSTRAEIGYDWNLVAVTWQTARSGNSGRWVWTWKATKSTWSVE